MDNKTIEYLYKSGKMPLKYYNQLNGKTAQENFAEYKTQQQEDFSTLLDKTDLHEVIENAIADVLKSL